MPVPLNRIGRLLVVGVIAIVAGAVLWGSSAVAARVGGGNAVAGAPDLPLGRQIAKSWNQSQHSENGRYGEFWRAQLNVRDRLIIDWALTKSGCRRVDRGILVYSPSVTDDTVARASTAAAHTMNGTGNNEFVWVAPSAGRWLLFFYGCRQTTSTVVAWVQRFTQTRVTVPSHVTRGHLFTVTGTVRGTATGTVAVAVNGLGETNPLPVGASITRGGNFTTRIRLHQIGVYTLQVTYFGDSNHRASRAAAKIQVG